MNLLQTSAGNKAASQIERLTIADGLFALILLLGGIIRFVELGRLPLSEAEAALALSVWQFWQPGAESLAISSPAYFTLTMPLSLVFGFSDAVMRLAPAVFGLGVAALPWLLRSRLGTVGALVTSLFLAISPLVVVVSRTAGGEAMALFALLLLLTGWVLYRDTAVEMWLYLAAAATGLGLAASPLFYSGLAALALGWLVVRLFRLPFFGAQKERPGGKTWLRALLVGGGVFVALSSSLLWVPGGMGSAAGFLGQWLAQFGGGNGRSLAEPFLAVIRYEPALLLLGLLGIAWAIWRHDGWGLLLVYWLAAILLLMLVQPGAMSLAVLAILPGYMLVGLVADYVLAKESWNRLTWLVSGGLLLVLFLILVNISRFLRVITFDPQEIRYIVVMLLALVAALMLMYFVMTVNLTAVSQGILLAFIGFLTVITWGSGWWLGHQAANDPRERWVAAGTEADVRLLASTLHDLSYQFRNAAADLDLVSSVDTPVLRWYLRDFEQTAWGNTLPVMTAQTVMITPAETEQAVAEAYTGQDFRIGQTSLPTTPMTLSWETAVETLRWWLFHETGAPVQHNSVILWVRSDLAQP